MKHAGEVHHYDSPVGWLELVVSDRGVRSVSFIPKPKVRQTLPDNPIIQKLVKELDRYFAGESITFSVPLDPPEGTEFQREVWEQLTTIPYGETRSYGEVAEAMGRRRSARAVGNANGSNSIPIIIPCHRVIKSDGSLGGYGSGVHIKKFLLNLEGVE